jgi:hypothetical protein
VAAETKALACNKHASNASNAYVAAAARHENVSNNPQANEVIATTAETSQSLDSLKTVYKI